MIPGNYEQILEKISKNSGLAIDEIGRKIEAKRAKLSGLISKEGAAQIIASELGISFEKEKMKVKELLNGMRKINLVGKIIRMNRVVSYDKNGRQGKIGSFLLADDTSNVRIVLWDVNHIELIEKGEIKEGDVVEITSGDVRNGEMHLSSFSDIKKSSEVIEKVVETKVVVEKEIKDIGFNESVSVRAFVVQIFGPSFFKVCPECNKKVQDDGSCAEHGAVASKQRAIVNFILDDGTNSIRCTLFHDQIAKLAGEEALVSTETFMPKREEFLGKEFIVNGNARRNNFSQSLELIANDVVEINIDQLIEKLEKGN
jgi:ssDNA-binding replication factor A large subunit